MSAALDRFGDGVALPVVAVQPFDDGVLSLDALYQLALTARARGESYVFATVPGDGRAWAMTFKAHGIPGLIVRRFREPATDADVTNGRPIDSGAVAQLVVRFNVVDVLLTYKREYFRLNNPNSAALGVNRRRRRPVRNVTIR